jgi:hypothetical protein
VNGTAVGSYPLTATGIKVSRMLCVPAKLRKGENEVAMEFTCWDDTANGSRPLSLAITELSFFPDLGLPPDVATARRV